MPKHGTDRIEERQALGRWASFALLLLGAFLVCSSALVSAYSARDALSPGLFAMKGRLGDEPLAVADPTPYFYLSPTILELGPNGIGDMEIRTSSVTDLAGVQFDLQWDPTLVEVVDADPGKLGVQITRGDMFDGYNTFSPANGNLVDNVTGKLSYAIALVGADIGVSGVFHVGTVRYHAIGTGTSSVVFTGTIFMVGRGGVDIPSGYGNGEIRIVGVTLTPTVTPTETEIPTVPVPTETTIPTMTEIPTIPVPTATPTISCWDIMEDGSFDDPNSDAWVLLDQALASGENARTGEKSLWLAGFDDARDSAYQQVYLPANATSVTVSYWLDDRLILA